MDLLTVWVSTHAKHCDDVANFRQDTSSFALLSEGSEASLLTSSLLNNQICDEWTDCFGQRQVSGVQGLLLVVGLSARRNYRDDQCVALTSSRHRNRSRSAPGKTKVKPPRDSSPRDSRRES